MKSTAVPSGGTLRKPPARRSTGLRSGLLACLAAALLLVTGCGDDGGQDDGGTGTSAAQSPAAADVLGPTAPAQGEPVRIGLVTDGKNAVTDQSVELTVADATVKYLNERRSGIGGRPIELVTCESLADPGKTVDCANRMVEENVVAVIVGAVASMETLWEPLREAGLPMMFYSGGGADLLRDTGATFALSDSNAGIIDFPIQLAKDSGASKVSFVVIDVPGATSVLKTIAPPLFEEAGVEMELVAIPPGTADMNPQMQTLVNGDPGVVFILGNDAFCISALNGLRSAGFTGQVSGIAQCISDATREAVPADMLDGMVVSATTPIGVDNPSTRLYNAVATTYGKDIDTSRIAGMNTFIVLAAFQSATEGISGDITPEAITATIKAMPEKELPAGGGLRFRCNGKADPSLPAVCVRGGLIATLDGEGHPIEYKVVGASPIED